MKGTIYTQIIRTFPINLTPFGPATTIILLESLLRSSYGVQDEPSDHQRAIFECCFFHSILFYFNLIIIIEYLNTKSLHSCEDLPL